MINDTCSSRRDDGYERGIRGREKGPQPIPGTFMFCCHAEPKAKHLARPWPGLARLRFFVELVLSLPKDSE